MKIGNLKTNNLVAFLLQRIVKVDSSRDDTEREMTSYTLKINLCTVEILKFELFLTLAKSLETLSRPPKKR